MYIKTTNNVKITVQPTYLKDQSEPAVNHYVWAYTVQIENLGKQTLQLQSRYWHITNAIGQVQEVEGEGVVGEQPILKAGEAFKYTSGASLITPSGIMSGRYRMIEKESGTELEVEIPAFSLDCPYADMRPN
ncbi:MAG: Co2+/Mg2+ efflux protein ApaG [Alphaproteobacteria bacterium]|nr:Co2+/Mg2+ efflux protein ApaG [Alphaproteobacteria bacterium]